ncbi:hypothetical protein GEV02_01855 [Rugamonas sp. FT29W]|uniref:DUF5916 domain-containing protein n=2 Tax=Rugamonas aquatica TaxID=2743357 RepID=A0A6A7MV44_9BURK|nr:hypothetical protein [Rugamonas aquatica]
MMQLTTSSHLRRSLLSALIFVTASAAAEDKLRIPRAAHAPVLADYVTGIPADAGVEVKGFRQFQPGDGQPASLETRAYLSYDDQNFYAVFVCKDDPKLVRARIARREDLPGDDAVQLDLDTFHDKQRSFRFYANPYGVQMDAKHTEGLGDDFNFDTQWTSDGKLTADGYVVMMAIPFKSLRFRSADVQDWGVSVGRIVPRLNEFSYWPYITQRQEAFVPQMAAAEIAAPVSAGRNIQLNPYAYLGRSRALDQRDPTRPGWQHDNKNQAGLDAKFVLADAFAVDLTFNPDFSEVESDEPQVIIDQRYEVQFPEKRPFFLENSGFFATPQQLFFSRRIIDPQLGARITGRTGNWSLGGLLMNDEAAGKLAAPGDAAYGKKASITVARGQRDFDTDSNLGAMVTDRRIAGHANTVAGVDLRWKLDENWVASGQAASSRTSDNGAPDSTGSLAYAELRRTDRNFNYAATYLDVSRRFDSELAFIPRTDIRQLGQEASYMWNFTDAPWLVSTGPSIKALYTKDHDGQLQDWSSDAWYTVKGLRATTFEAHKLDAHELYAGQRFHKNGYQLAASTEWFDWLNGWIKVGQNDVINYVPAAGTQAALGDARSVSANIKFTPHPQFRVEQTLFWNDLRTKGGMAGVGAGTGVYRELLSRTKFNYQYSRFLSAHLILDYTNLRTNSQLTALSGGKQLTADLLFSYLLSPGTSLFAGYTDRQENLQLVGNPALLERTRGLELHTGRKAFIKLNYLFQL